MARSIDASPPTFLRRVGILPDYGLQRKVDISGITPFTGEKTDISIGTDYVSPELNNILLFNQNISEDTFSALPRHPE